MINTKDIFNIGSDYDFIDLALKIFQFQWEHNSVYRSYCDLLYVNPVDITSMDQIPFLPIQFFKSHRILSNENEVQKIFKSSGTTSSMRSEHLLTDLPLYEESFNRCFEYFYGNPEDYIIIALLPSYLEQGDSSLIYMMDHLILRAKEESGFFLKEMDDLMETISVLEKKSKVLLMGVSYALLDLAEKFPRKLNNTTIMETGGMKGRRKEMIREELHQKLKNAFEVNEIHSEYGMTELLSQAYSKGEGKFACPPWMKVIGRDPQEPLKATQFEATSGINIIDLANINSCSFIATQDLGRIAEDGSFEVLGRFDHSDIRGCNLMVI